MSQTSLITSSFSSWSGLWPSRNLSSASSESFCSQTITFSLSNTPWAPSFLASSIRVNRCVGCCRCDINYLPSGYDRHQGGAITCGLRPRGWESLYTPQCNHLSTQLRVYGGPVCQMKWRSVCSSESCRGRVYNSKLWHTGLYSVSLSLSW